MVQLPEQPRASLGRQDSQQPLRRSVALKGHSSAQPSLRLCSCLLHHFLPLWRLLHSPLSPVYLLLSTLLSRLFTLGLHILTGNTCCGLPTHSSHALQPTLHAPAAHRPIHFSFSFSFRALLRMDLLGLFELAHDISRVSGLLTLFLATSLAAFSYALCFAAAAASTLLFASAFFWSSFFFFALVCCLCSLNFAVLWSSRSLSSSFELDL